MHPLHSVTDPAYDAADTLEECLHALLDHTIPRWQYAVIVVNDGSTDRTEEFAKKYDVRLVSQPNQGRAEAKNAGIHAARGEFLLFIDADCAATKRWVEGIIAPFANQEVVGVAGTLHTEQRNIVARFTQIEYETKYEIMARSQYVDIVDTASAAYRKQVFEGNGLFDASLFTAEDTDFSFRLAHRGYKMIFARCATVFHRHPETIFDYARRKWGYGYCRTFLYRRYPQKVVVDRRTPQSQKIQAGLVLLLGQSVLGLAFSKWFLGVTIALVGMFLVSTLPFCLKAAKKDPAVALVSPLFLFVRATAGALGVAMGVAYQVVKKLNLKTLKRNAPSIEH